VNYTIYTTDCVTKAGLNTFTFTFEDLVNKYPAEDLRMIIKE